VAREVDQVDAVAGEEEVGQRQHQRQAQALGSRHCAAHAHGVHDVHEVEAPGLHPAGDFRDALRVGVQPAVGPGRQAGPLQRDHRHPVYDAAAGARQPGFRRPAAGAGVHFAAQYLHGVACPLRRPRKLQGHALGAAREFGKELVDDEQQAHRRVLVVPLRPPS
jgi:hypothetical protein